jgi:hypothetical protein
MKIAFEIDDKRVANLLYGHAGGYSSWLKELARDSDPTSLGAWATYSREGDDEGVFNGSTYISNEAIAEGLSKMAADGEGSYHWRQFMEGDDDEVSFDTAWQFIIFGKLVYA